MTTLARSRPVLAVRSVAAAAAVAAVIAGFDARGADGCPAGAWPHWQRYRAAFLSGDGRVIDRSAADRTTSEGQAYALFHSLVANDRATFDAVLRWTEQNLARGDLGGHLPAWNWGKAPDGTWRVLDANAASDADLWMAYALLEAGRLWGEPRYDGIARRLLATVTAQEVVALPGLGPMLLPGPRGFVLDGGRAWRLNPSYLPPQVLRRLAAVDAAGPWSSLLASADRMLRDSAPRGAVPDWVRYRDRAGFGTDPVTGPRGSYDAIRSYLWLGMEGRTGGSDSRAPAAPLEVFTQRGTIPERIDVRTLRGTGRAPVGFYAAVLPLARRRDPDAARRIEEVLRGALRDGLYGSPPAYYDQNLALFGVGFAERRFRFEPDGRLTPDWEAPCAARR